MSARKMTELTVHVQSQVGELARVLGLASQAGANVVAFCGYEHGDDSGATILVVPDKPDRAQAALQKAGYAVRAFPVVTISGAAGRGMGTRLAEKLSKAGINVVHSYASSSGNGQSTAVFRVLKPDLAVKALKS